MLSTCCARYLLKYYFIIYVCMLIVQHVGTCYLWRPEEGVTSSGSGLRGGCEPRNKCWEPKPGPLQEQLVLLIAETPGGTRALVFVGCNSF